MPNAAARSLRSRRTDQIVFAMPDVANPVYTAMVSSIQEVARTGGFRLLLHSTGRERRGRAGHDPRPQAAVRRRPDPLLARAWATSTGASSSRAAVPVVVISGPRSRHPRRHRPGELAEGRRRGRPPPPRRRPAPDRVRQRPAEHGPGQVAAGRLPRRPARVRARARRDAGRGRRGLHGRARSRRLRAPARARAARRDLLRQRPARRRRARGAARAPTSTCPATSQSWGWTTRRSPSTPGRR